MLVLRAKRKIHVKIKHALALVVAMLWIACGQPNNIQNAEIHTCPMGVVGCSPTIKLQNGQDMILSQSSVDVQRTIAIYGQYQSPHGMKILLSNAQGVTLQSTGYMPNPSAVQTVFQLTNFNVLGVTPISP